MGFRGIGSGSGREWQRIGDWGTQNTKHHTRNPPQTVQDHSTSIYYMVLYTYTYRRTYIHYYYYLLTSKTRLIKRNPCSIKRHIWVLLRLFDRFPYYFRRHFQGAIHDNVESETIHTYSYIYLVHIPNTIHKKVAKPWNTSETWTLHIY